ncbi:hypothetical protein Tco_1561215 [Tanacetum coccineum]
MKNNSVCKENGSNVFRKEREQYHEIQDLKAQMQDKNIAISELKKLIEMQRKYLYLNDENLELRSIRFNTSAGNPVKKILLKLNLSDHRLCKMVVECRSVKVKEFQERCNIKAFQEWYEHVGPEVASPQDGKVTRWRRDCAWLMISRCSRSQCQIQVQGTSSIQEVNDHYNIFTRESQEYELKTKDKA